ncbi:MAG: glycosyltransferase [Leeuwenhoekiella sp.]
MLNFEKVDFKESSKADYMFDEKMFETSKRWHIAKQLFQRVIEEKGSENKIPKKIHQIWIGSEVPKSYENWRSSWKKYHPDWEYFLWTESEIRSLKLDLQDIYDNSHNFGVKSDVLRYEILNKYGGLYVDTDFECIKEFDHLQEGLDFYAGLMNGSDAHLCNALIASIPGHPIMKKMLEAIKKPIVTHNSDEILNTTGPGAFTKVFFENYQSGNLVNVAFPITFFYCLPNNKLHIHSRKKIFSFTKPESFAIHYWTVSWQNTTRLKKFTSKFFRYIPQRNKDGLKDKLGALVKFFRTLI